MTDATWDGFLDGNWNNTGGAGGSNWNPNTIPDGTATFPNSASNTNISFSNPGTTSVGTIQFGGTQLYTFLISHQTLDLTGSGLVFATDQTFSVINLGVLRFDNGASAGTGTLDVTSGGISFFESSSAGSSQISVGGIGGLSVAGVTFLDTSSASSASIVVNNKGLLSFLNNSSAGSAVIHTLSGGETDFLGTSVGGTATLNTDAGGTVDIDSHTGALVVGAIEGGGKIIDGSNTLTTVDVVNIISTFSGTISGTGGLTKDGPGTLILTGSNTYTGVTSIIAGTLELGVGGSISGDVAFKNFPPPPPPPPADNVLPSTGPSTLTGPVLKIDGATQFNGTIDDVLAGDSVDLAFHNFTAGDHAVWVENGGNTGGTLSLLNNSGAVITILNLSGQYTSAAFSIASDGSNGTLLTNDVLITPTAIQNGYLAITRTPLSLDQATTESNAIIAGTATETKYVNSLLSQVADTTIPVVAVEGSMYGAVGSSAVITNLVINFLPGQLAYAMQVGLDPGVFACLETALVFAFANEAGATTFADNYGSSNAAMPATAAGDAAFAAAATNAIFGSAQTANTANALLGYVNFLEGFFTANGIVGVQNPTADQIIVAARAGAWGEGVAIALENNLGSLPGQTTNFLEDAAQGTAIYSAPFSSQPTATPFQGAAIASVAIASHVQVTGIAAPIDHIAM
jgi:autotransporter-associated beta strand protein